MLATAITTLFLVAGGFAFAAIACAMRDGVARSRAILAELERIDTPLPFTRPARHYRDFAPHQIAAQRATRQLPAAA